MKIFLHIGTHKTGSTAIQNLFANNRECFIKQSLYYPEGHENWSGHHHLPWMIKRNELSELDQEISNIIERAYQFNCDKILISSEELEFISNKSALSIFKKYGELEIVSYLRRQDDYLESEYNQHVKMFSTRFDSDIFHFFSYHNFHPRFNYLQLLQPWIDVAGSDHIHVVSYDSLGKGKGIYNAIFKILSVNDNEVTYPEPSAENVSLSHLSTLYLSRLNKVKSLTNQQHQKAIEYLQVNLPKDQRKLIPYEYRVRLLERYKIANYRVAELFTTNLMLFEKQPVDSFGTLDYCEDFDESFLNGLKASIQVNS